MQTLLNPYENGRLKAGWVVKKLGEIADPNIRWSFIGGPFGSNLKSSDYTKEGIRIIQLQNIGDGHFINDYSIYTSVMKADELISNNIYPGDIILSKMGDPVARACIIPDFHDRYLMCSDGIRLVADKNQCNNHFLFYYINSPNFRILAENASTGTTRKRIGLTELRNLEIKLPEITEQSQIAEILKAMDTEIAALEAKLAKYRHIKQGMMQNLLTGRIRLVKPESNTGAAA
jgi:type I restriction enzyme S subunit